MVTVTICFSIQNSNAQLVNNVPRNGPKMCPLQWFQNPKGSALSDKLDDYYFSDSRNLYCCFSQCFYYYLHLNTHLTG